MDEYATRKFLDRLWELQREAGLNDAQLAEKIPCTPSYISHMKAGRRGSRIGLDFALGSARIFPSLHAFFLPSDFPVGNTVVPVGNDAE